MEKGKINWAYKIKHVITYVAILSIIAFIVFALDRNLLMQKFERPKSELPEYFKKHIWLLVLNCVLYFGTIYFGI